MSSSPVKLQSSCPPSLRKPPTSRAQESLDFSELEDMVTFIVGPEMRRKKIHKSIVCQHSKPLSAAFNGNFVEGTTQEYVLKEYSQGTFTLFAQWLYSENLKNDDEKKIAVQDLVSLWVLADMLIMPALQNRTIDLINEIYISRKEIAVDVIPWVWENTAPCSPLQHLFLNMVYRDDDPKFFFLRQKDLPQSFLSLVCGMLRGDLLNHGITHGGPSAQAMVGYYV
ncbi:hypothetical protein VTL71DRAFT_12084 [Oculimacula yallundae]|uniref:BTB domain-containing protein n=1 Tax=Oculimacula yallundae TaxID=86028 RepID=A0ABR4CTJ4_9HELO